MEGAVWGEHGAELLSAVEAVAFAASKTTEPEVLASIAIREAARLVAAGGATLRWYERSGRLRLLAHDGIVDESSEALDAGGETAIAEAIRLRRPVVVNRYQHSRRATPWGLRAGVQAVAALPLLVESRPVGGMAMMSFQPRRFSTGDIAALRVLAAIMAPSLEAARLTAEIERQERIANQVYEALGASIVVFDRDGRPVFHNRAAETFLGGGLTGIETRTLPLFHDDGTRLTLDDRPTSRVAASLQPLRGVTLGADLAGGRRWAQVDAIPVFDAKGELELVVTSGVDVSALKAAEAQQRAAADRLRELIGLQAKLGDPELGIAEAMELIVAATSRTTSSGGTAIQTVEEGGFQFHAVDGLGAPLAGLRLTLNLSLIGLALESGRTEYADDAANDPRCDRNAAVRGGIGSMAVTPVRHQDEVIGALMIFSGELDSFGEEQFQTLEMLAGLAGAAISRSRARVALLESEHRYSAVIESALDPIVLFDPAGQIVEFNPAAERAFGRVRSETLGQPIALLVGEERRSSLARWLAEGARAGSAGYAGLRFETIGRRADGSEFPIEVAIAELPQASHLVAAYLRDLTSERESAAKSQVMATMGHEVRTPLNSVLGFAELLRSTARGDLNPTQLRYVANIEAAGRHLLTLVNDSLDLARLNSGTLRMELGDLDVRSVLEQAAEQMRPLAEARELTLTVAAPRGLAVWADCRRLLQVLWNLLGNAIRHTTGPGTVALSAETRGDGVAIHVADTGEGIADVDLERIFEEYFRAHEHGGEGTGLGLPISRRLLQLMGGTIEVRSTVGEGSTFTAWLPSATGRPN